MCLYLFLLFFVFRSLSNFFSISHIQSVRIVSPVGVFHEKKKCKCIKYAFNGLIAQRTSGNLMVCDHLHIIWQAVTVCCQWPFLGFGFGHLSLPLHETLGLSGAHVHIKLSFSTKAVAGLNAPFQIPFAHLRSVSLDSSRSSLQVTRSGHLKVYYVVFVRLNDPSLIPPFSSMS